MPRNYRFHIIALSIICSVITAMYLVVGPKQAPSQTVEVKDPNDRVISIYSATWGENCNLLINQSIRDRERMPAKRDEKNDRAEKKPLVPVPFNNVLKQVGDECNGKLSCSVRASVGTFDNDPLQSCFKNLVVGYRCFSFDRIWNVETKQGDLLKIDCEEKAPSASQ
jgi:hypothetical protein